MRPAWSIISFTTLAGAAQGLLVALALALLVGGRLEPGFVGLSLAVALVLLLAGMVASFLHLGHPERAWRAVLMWRTSWLSREVIVLPALVAAVALWALAWQVGAPAAWLAALEVLTVLLALALWLCTAMIYACIRFIQEWAHPLTVINYTLIGLSSGLVLAGALAALAADMAFLQAILPWALGATAAAGFGRWVALRRNAGLKPKSTLQSATGIAARPLKQTSMGMTGGAFNTREFFHGATLALQQRARLALLVLGFALPCALLVAGLWAGLRGAPQLTVLTSVLALVLQAPGLVAERWCFFAQARHPQNLYYQVVS
jgi:DMSO reductase anchor subunit